MTCQTAKFADWNLTWSDHWTSAGAALSQTVFMSVQVAMEPILVEWSSAFQATGSDGETFWGYSVEDALIIPDLFY